MASRKTTIKCVSTSKEQEEAEITHPNIAATSINNGEDGKAELTVETPASFLIPSSLLTTFLERMEQMVSRLTQSTIQKNTEDQATNTSGTFAKTSSDITTDHPNHSESPIAECHAQATLPEQAGCTQNTSPVPPANVFNKFLPNKISPKFVEQSIGQLEAWFTINNINHDDEKFALLKLSIEPETYQQVAAVIQNPPATNKFLALKNCIVKTFTRSEATRIKALLNHMELGNRRPSQLLSEMCALYKGPKDRIFIELFISRLPSTVRGILMGMKPGNSETEPPLEIIAQWADSIMEQLDKDEKINTIQATPTTPKIEQMMVDLKDSINAFNQRDRHQYQVLPKPFYTGTRSRTPAQHSQTQKAGPAKITRPRNWADESESPPRQPNRERRAASIERHTICWYHRKFGRDANSCASPCAHPKN